MSASPRPPTPWLDRLARVGDRLPDPVVLFLGACLVLIVLSLLGEAGGWSVPHPGTGEPSPVTGLLHPAGIRRMLTDAVKNFVAFPPLGTVLVMMVGVGVAERSGLIGASLQLRLVRLPPRALTPSLMLVSILASAAADAGFVVLIPLGAALYASLGRHPLLGVAVVYAGVGGGYSANLLLTALDPLLAGLTTSAARLLVPDCEVPATANWWFMAVSVPMLTAIGTLVAERWVAPRLASIPWERSKEEEDVAAPVPASRGLAAAGLAALVVPSVTVLLVASGVLYDSVDGTGYRPLFDSVVTLIALGFFLPGVAYAVVGGRARSSGALVQLAAASLGGLGSYIVLIVVASQFVAWFSWSNLGIWVAVHGAATLRDLGLGPLALLVGLAALTAVSDLLVPSASAKWALFAPVFVPMLMLLGVEPAWTQAAYRVGDSVSNVVSPLLPYLPIVLLTARRYVPAAGLGTVFVSQLPFAAAFFGAWMLLLALWFELGLPLGPGTAACAL